MTLTVGQIEERLGHPLSLIGVTDLNELATLRRQARRLAEEYEEVYMLEEAQILWGFADAITEKFRKLD